MTTATAPLTPTLTAIGERRKFTESDRRAMLQAGIIALEDGIELRNGELFCKHSGARRRFTVDEYYALAEAGILGPEERVELLDGEIIAMAPMHSPHAACITDFDELLRETLGRRATVRVQCPVRLNSGYEPEPDLALLRRRADSYATGHPIPDDVLLLIEVADSSVRTDRRRKIPIYAQHGIPEVWLADLTLRHVEVYDQPIAAGYARIRTIRIDGSLTPAAFPDVAIPVNAVMPE